MKKFELGAKLRDVVTGFEGIATERVEMLNGCVQYQLVEQGPHENGKEIKTVSVDAHQLEYVDDGIRDFVEENKDDDAPTGGRARYNQSL